MDAVHNVPCTFVSNWIEGTTHESIFHKLWKLLLQVVCIFPIFIAFSHKSQWKIWLVHDKLWKWLLQVVCIFPIFIAFTHRRQWKIRLVHDNFCKWYVSSLYLLLSHINVNEKYNLSMTTFASGMYLPYIYCFLT